jgi:hypothetical protein
MAHLTIEDLAPRVVYAPTVTTSVFAVPFGWFAASDIRVFVNRVELVNGPGFTLAGTTVTGGFQGGAVTLGTAVSGVEVVVARDITVRRTTDFPEAGPFPVQVLNTELDRLTAILQEIKDRALYVSLHDLYYDARARRIVNAAEPVLSSDLATKAYVDRLVGLPGADYGTGIDGVVLRSWLAGMAAFLTAWQGSGGSYIVNAQNIVRNNLHDELGRAGYLPPQAATSESQTMMARGFLLAHKATGEAAYLATAKALAEAFIDHYAGGVEPPASGLWGHHWIVNAGPAAVPVQGPAAVPYTGAGNLGSSISFTAGVGDLGTSLALVYRVFAGTLGWDNAFSGLNAGGVDYAVDYYIASDGTRRTGRKADGSWGEVIGAVTGETPGKIVLANTGFTGSLKVSHSVYTGATIPVNSGFEAWPMWRQLVGGEQVMAVDAIHWALDVFVLLKGLEPAVPRWGNAVNRLVETYGDAATYRTSTKLFERDVGAQYNSQPLTYWFGLRGGTAFHSPDASVTAGRDAGGAVQFDLAPDAAREGFYFENGELLVTTTSGSIMSAELGSNAALGVEITVANADGSSGVAEVSLAGSGIETKSLALAEFRTWPSGAWRPGDTTFVFGTGSEAITTNTDGAVPWPVARVTLGDATGGWGFARSFGVPFRLLVRGRSGDATLRLTDGAGWFWYRSLANTGALTELSLNWSTGWTTTGYQDLGGTPPGSPVGGAATALVLLTASAAVVDVAYAAATTPLALGAGDLSKVTLKYDTDAAVQLKVGDVSFSASSRMAIPYQPGAAPFNYGMFGGSKRGPGGAFFQGPIYAGYQSSTPWYQSGDAAAARNLYDFLAASQAAYTASTGIVGPFAPVFVPATYDSLDYGAANSWTWEGPDPNTAWGGFQYRSFFAAAEGWSAWGSAVPLAATVCTRFLTWLDRTLADNPGWTAVPGVFSEGVPPAPAGADSHMVALCLRGTVHCRLAGADRATCARVMRRLMAMLAGRYNATGLMAGSFPPTPGVAVYYGFWHGEIMAAVAEALYHHERGEL